MKDAKPEVFSGEFLAKIRERFWYVDQDPINGNRVYFENAGGSLRLKAVTEQDQLIVSLPDSPSRPSKAARWLGDMVEQGKEDFRLLVGAKGGDILPSISASRAIFHIIGAILANVPGTNVVTTKLEHPASYDAVHFYAGKTGKEVRIAPINHADGSVDPAEILALVDRNTSMLAVIYASNMTGAVLDIKLIAAEARKINPDIYIVVDAVQHVPHAAVDVADLGVDGLVVAPYKMFGKRGLGLGYISERVAALPHDEVYGKSKDRWSVGSADPSGFNSLSRIVDYICWIGREFGAGDDRRAQILQGMAKINGHEQALLHRLLYGGNAVPGLKHMAGVTVHSVPDAPSHRDLILAINIDKLDATASTKKYQEKGITVFERLATSAFSQRILRDLGLPGIVRVSPMHFNTPEEVDQFLKVTEEIVFAAKML
ncbi:MAG: aminotransferase class V-fold PLP-dependent enzyme [Negativicutes bacterium]|nr:aminotransferase class V-fold PLP-dependent enzyme [Negativicutes bacterium]